MKFTSLKCQLKIQILVIISASVSCIGYGMHYSWTSPSIPILTSDSSLDISIEEASYLVVCQALAMGISAPFSSAIIDKLGRKFGVLLIVVPHVIAWIMIGNAHNIWTLYLAKFMVGIGESGVYTAVFVYICEITEPEIRNGWTNIPVIATYLGIFLVNLIGTKMSVSATAWVCMITSGIHFIVFPWAPESPYYLIMKNREDDAKASLRMLRMSIDVDKEYTTLVADVARQQTESGVWMDIFSIESNRKALIIVMGLRLLQQCSGVTVFEVYTQYIFEEADVSLSASTSTLVFTGISFLSVTFCLYAVHKFGRRPLLLCSTLGSALSLMAEGIYFSLKTFTTLNTDYFYWFPLSGMIVYIFFSSLGLATLPSVISGEVCATSIKGKIMMLNNLVFALSLLVLPKIFQILTTRLGIYAPFYLFSAFCFVGVAFVYLYVIETRGKTLEQIQQELKDNSYEIK